MAATAPAVSKKEFSRPEKISVKSGKVTPCPMQPMTPTT
jgi:hypothetical protein